MGGEEEIVGVLSARPLLFSHSLSLSPRPLPQVHESLGDMLARLEPPPSSSSSSSSSAPADAASEQDQGQDQGQGQGQGQQSPSLSRRRLSHVAQSQSRQARPLPPGEARSRGPWLPFALSCPLALLPSCLLPLSPCLLFVFLLFAFQFSLSSFLHPAPNPFRPHRNTLTQTPNTQHTHSHIHDPHDPFIPP